MDQATFNEVGRKDHIVSDYCLVSDQRPGQHDYKVPAKHSSL